MTAVCQTISLGLGERHWPIAMVRPLAGMSHRSPVPHPKPAGMTRRPDHPVDGYLDDLPAAHHLP
jgi:hypothetical protein